MCVLSKWRCNERTNDIRESKMWNLRSIALLENKCLVILKPNKWKCVHIFDVLYISLLPSKFIIKTETQVYIKREISNHFIVKNERRTISCINCTRHNINWEKERDRNGEREKRPNKYRIESSGEHRSFRSSQYCVVMTRKYTKTNTICKLYLEFTMRKGEKTK